MDEDFLFGSHVLVASVTNKGDTSKMVYLPAKANDGEMDLGWCELDTGIWHLTNGSGRFVELGESSAAYSPSTNLTSLLSPFAVAPLARTPVLVRGGGILVLGGRCTSNIYDSINSRTVLIFPSSSLCPSGLSGSFTLVEDDGRTNEHLEQGVYTELDLHFAVKEDEVEVWWELVHGGYCLPYREIAWQLPKGDRRTIVAARGMAGRREKGSNGDIFSLVAPEVG